MAVEDSPWVTQPGETISLAMIRVRARVEGGVRLQGFAVGRLGEGGVENG